SRATTASSSSRSAARSARATTSRWSTTGGRAVLEQDDVAPDAVALAELLVHAEHSESQSAVEREARLVLGEDPREQRPVPGRLGLRDQLAEERAADTAATRRSADVHALLRDTAVAASVRIRRERGPPEDRAL